MERDATNARSRRRESAIRRRRRGLLLLVAGVMLIGALAYAFRPSGDETAVAIDPTTTMSAIEIAAQKAAKNASAGAKAASEVENRAWSIGQYASQIPATDGVNAGAGAGNLVALTFDDGPGKDTWDVLALLKRYKMHATFFVVGQAILKNPGAIEAAAAEGHVVADHTMTHASLPSLNATGLKRELGDTKTLIREATGIAPTLMRPPFGDFTAKTNQFSHRLGLLPTLWTIDSNDWALTDSASVAENVLNSPALKPGAIILLHDGSMNRQVTVNALPMILDGLVQRGLRSVTVPELLRAGPPGIARPGDYTLSDYATPD